MKLLQFRIEHFRCLYSTDWIPFSSLAILTGENDGGKSSTINALELFLNPRGTPSGDDFSYTLEKGASEDITHENEICLFARFELSDKEHQVIQRVGRIQDRQIEIRRIYKSDGTQTDYSFTCEVIDKPFFLKPLEEYTIDELRQFANETGIELKSSRLKDDLISQIRTWMEDKPRSPKEVKVPSELINLFPEIRIFSSETALDPQSEIRRTLMTFFKHIIDSDKYSGQISSITSNVENDLNTEVEKLEPFIKQYSNGDIETVTIRPTFNFGSGLATTDLQLKRKDGKQILLVKSGAGQRRRFSLAVYEWSLEVLKEREEGSRQLILAFDEPDTHLDYKSQRQIFDVIRKFSILPATQVIVCTHSLNLIERVPITQIIHFRLDKEKHCTSIERLTTEDHETTDLFLFELSKNMGLRNSVMLHERCFLAVEGGSEFAALPVMFYKAYDMPLQSAGICLISGENNFGARMLIKFLNANKRNVLFLVDTDSITTDSIKKNFTPKSFETDGIDIKSQVFYIGKKEFEDAFSDETWTRVAESHYPKPSKKKWETGEFAALREKSKFSLELQKLLHLESGLDEEPSKPEIGYNLAVTITKEEVPPIILDCLKKAYELGNS